MKSHIVFFSISVGLKVAGAAAIANLHTGDKLPMLLFHRDALDSDLRDFLHGREFDDSRPILIRRGKKGKDQRRKQLSSPPKQQQLSTNPTGTTSTGASSGSKPGPSGREQSNVESSRGTRSKTGATSSGPAETIPSSNTRSGKSFGSPGLSAAKSQSDTTSGTSSTPSILGQSWSNIDTPIRSLPRARSDQRRSRQDTPNTPSPVGRAREGSESSGALASGTTSSSGAPSSYSGPFAPGIAKLSLDSPTISNTGSTGSARSSRGRRPGSSPSEQPSSSGHQSGDGHSTFPLLKDSHSRSSSPTGRGSKRASSSGPTAQTKTDPSKKVFTLPVRPSRIESHRSIFESWWPKAREDIYNAQINAAELAPRPGTFSPLAKGNVATAERKDAAEKKARAKDARAQSKHDYSVAESIFPHNEAGLTVANAAFYKATMSANEAVKAGRAHSVAENVAAKASAAKGDWAGTDKHLQAAGRAYQRYILRNSRTKAFQDRYIAQVGRGVAAAIPDAEKDKRRQAYSEAVWLQKNYEHTVDEARDRESQYRQVKDEFHGSSSDEGEQSYPDVRKSPRNP